MSFKVSIKSPYDQSVRVGTQQRRLKIKLFKRHNQRCFYCGVKTIIHSRHIRGNYPNNTATVEHLYTKFDMRRTLSNKTVISCTQCNNKKGQEGSAEIFKEYKRVDFIISEYFNLQPEAL